MCTVPVCQAEPDDAWLLCALGDLTVDDACYERAWTASGGRSVRAKRCLARSAQRRQDFAAVRRLQGVVGCRHKKPFRGARRTAAICFLCETAHQSQGCIAFQEHPLQAFDCDRSPHVERHGEVAVCKQCDKRKDTA